MGFMGKMMVRAIASIAIVVLLMSGFYDIRGSLYEQVNAVLLVFAIISTDMLIERYLSNREDQES